MILYVTFILPQIQTNVEGSHVDKMEPVMRQMEVITVHVTKDTMALLVVKVTSSCL